MCPSPKDNNEVGKSHPEILSFRSLTRSQDWKQEETSLDTEHLTVLLEDMLPAHCWKPVTTEPSDSQIVPASMPVMRESLVEAQNIDGSFTTCFATVGETSHDKRPQSFYLDKGVLR